MFSVYLIPFFSLASFTSDLRVSLRSFGFFTGKEIIGALLSKLIILKVPKPRILPKIVCLNEVSDICYI